MDVDCTQWCVAQALPVQELVGNYVPNLSKMRKLIRIEGMEKGSVFFSFLPSRIRIYSVRRIIEFTDINFLEIVENAFLQ